MRTNNDRHNAGLDNRLFEQSRAAVGAATIYGKLIPFPGPRQRRRKNAAEKAHAPESPVRPPLPRTADVSKHKVEPVPTRPKFSARPLGLVREPTPLVAGSIGDDTQIHSLGARSSSFPAGRRLFRRHGDLFTALLLAGYLVMLSLIAQRMAQATSWPSSLLLMAAVHVLMGAGFIVHARGAFPVRPAPSRWNATDVRR